MWDVRYLVSLKGSKDGVLLASSKSRLIFHVNDDDVYSVSHWRDIKKWFIALLLCRILIKCKTRIAYWVVHNQHHKMNERICTHTIIVVVKCDRLHAEYGTDDDDDDSVRMTVRQLSGTMSWNSVYKNFESTQRREKCCVCSHVGCLLPGWLCMNQN